ncbi:carbon-nitrogen hydrolase family protein [Bacillus smithii]|uniref:CN hydrolase domain-containing protein n=1 Tax=Bacillus smithii 7_3_47FAA TaxID=665952 RepID=G9QIK0_9BACI|nr:carbon-nitrogen hydrolase family protein [Bacillus smithii]EHL79020.1 hypothetical protein HMPREF1015_02291 [Bacillus smithii 7_3_47FAA]
MGKIRNEKLDKSVFGGHETVRVAAVQAPQIVFNKEKSIEVACKRIKEAGANGAKLVAFSETYIPVFPAYYKAGYASQIDEWAEWNIALQNNSVAIPSEDTEIIGKACREAGVYCVMGVNEIDDTDGARTLYNCQILFGPDGSILGRHRKLMPTFNERLYHGLGDGSDLNVYQTDIGRIGSLICWEHYTILVRAAQMLMGEEFHIANWPGTWTFGQKTNNGERKGRIFHSTTEPGDPCDLQFAIREYAFESGSFVISVAGLLREQDFEPEHKHFIDSPEMDFSWAVGGAAIVNPFGEYIAGPVYHDDTIIYADCHANEIKAAKVVFDGLGHYSRPDSVQILLHDHEQKNLLRSSKGLSYQDLKNISESTEVPLEKLEKVLEKIESRLSKPKTEITI